MVLLDISNDADLMALPINDCDDTDSSINPDARHLEIGLILIAMDMIAIQYPAPFILIPFHSTGTG